MDSNQSIADSISILAKAGSSHTNENRHAIVGTVRSINTDPNSGGQYAVVTPIDTNLTDISYVRLTPDDTISASIPVIGSQVIVNLFDDESGYIGQFGAINNMSLAVSSDGDNYGGLIKIADLVDRLNTAERTINDLRSMIINLISDYNGHTHTVSSFGSPSTPPSTIDTDTPPTAITLTTIHDIENPIVQHGNGSPSLSDYITQLDNARAAVQVAYNNLNNILIQMGNVVVTSNIHYSAYIQSLTIYQQKQQIYNDLKANAPTQ